MKVEINTREHFVVYGFKQIPFRVSSRWFEGSCEIHSYELDELLGTKLRALYQRKQGRDLFDLANALEKPEVTPERIVTAFLEYMKREGHKVSRAQFDMPDTARTLIVLLRPLRFPSQIRCCKPSGKNVHF